MIERQKRTPTIAILIAIFAATGACNQRAPFLDRDAVVTAPTAVVPASPADLARIAFYPPGNRGGATGFGTAYLDAPARDGGLAVTLRSSDASVVTVTPQIYIPGGAMSADFSFSTRTVTRDVNVTIPAPSGERT